MNAVGQGAELQQLHSAAQGGWTRKRVDALLLYDTGCSFVMLGPGGTGKIKTLLEMLRRQGWGTAVVVCANNL